jgi:16S rRNA (cytidine1402-2'-O)-methyltransferase
MAGCLRIVATPIGNLEDITLRALRVLREADLIAAEDTRRTGRLLQHYSISTPTTSLHEHNERQKIPMLLARLARGEQIAVVSDAGTPAISDPGARLVAATRQHGIRVEPVPGPSAVTAALSVSGFESDGFRFLGFPPIRSKDRKEWLEKLTESSEITVFFEAPHRVQATIDEIKQLLVDRPIFVGREMTKVHEDLVVRQICDLSTASVVPKGELVVVVAAPTSSPKRSSSEIRREELLVIFGYMTETLGLGRRTAITRLAQIHGVSARLIYHALEEAKQDRQDDPIQESEE